MCFQMGSEKWQCLDPPKRVWQLIQKSCHCHRETAVTVPDGLRDIQCIFIRRSGSYYLCDCKNCTSDFPNPPRHDVTSTFDRWKHGYYGNRCIVNADVNSFREKRSNHLCGNGDTYYTWHYIQRWLIHLRGHRAVAFVWFHSNLDCNVQHLRQ